MNIIKNKKVIYFADMMSDLQEDVKVQVIGPLKILDIEFHKIELIDMPPFDKKYDILFFDWGGMSMGNSLLESFCNQIVEEAEKYPNRQYIMVSNMTADAMIDALNELGEDAKRHNIFLSVKKFVEYYNTYELK